MFARKLIYVAVATSASLLSGCDQKDDRLLGTWVTASRTLEFKKDGQFTVRENGIDQTGTWERYGANLHLTMAGQEMTCSVNGNFRNQLVLVSTNAADPQGCSLALPYWRLDFPADKRTSTLVAFDCQTTGQTLGRIRYTPEFRIEVDKSDELACFGKTSTGCQFVWFTRSVTEDYFSWLVTWGDGTGNMLSMEKGSAPGKRDLQQFTSTSCGTDACSYSAYTSVGTCEKVVP